MILSILNVRAFVLMMAAVLLAGQVHGYDFVTGSGINEGNTYTVTDDDVTNNVYGDIVADGFKVRSGVTVTWSSAASVNGDVVIEEGGTLEANASGGLTSNGTITNSGLLNVGTGTVFTNNATLIGTTASSLVVHGTLTNSGTIALAIASGIGTSVVSSGGFAKHFDDYLNGMVVPYIGASAAIGGSNIYDLAPGDCTKGFIVGGGATLTINNDVTIADDGMIRIESGATLSIAVAKTLTLNASGEDHAAMYNNGTLNINGTLDSTGLITNDGVINNNGVLLNQNTATITNNGTMTSVSGASFNTNAGIVEGSGIWLADDRSYVNESLVSGNCAVIYRGWGQMPYLVAYLLDGNSIAQDGTATPSACANGFVVAKGATVTMKEDVSLSGGAIVIASGGALVVGNGGRVVLDVAGCPITLGSLASTLYLNGCDFYSGAQGIKLTTGTVVFDSLVRLFNKDFGSDTVNTNIDQAIWFGDGLGFNPPTLVYRTGAAVVVEGCMAVDKRTAGDTSTNGEGE